MSHPEPRRLVERSARPVFERECSKAGRLINLANASDAVGYRAETEYYCHQIIKLSPAYGLEQLLADVDGNVEGWVARWNYLLRRNQLGTARKLADSIMRTYFTSHFATKNEIEPEL